MEPISERYLLPVLERLLASLHLSVPALHSDNGSKYVSYQIAAPLEKLRVDKFSKLHPQCSNDYVLAESKNGGGIRKQFGFEHILGAPRGVPRPVPPRGAGPVPEPPPAVPVPVGGDRRQGESAQALPAGRHPYAERFKALPKTE